MKLTTSNLIMRPYLKSIAGKPAQILSQIFEIAPSLVKRFSSHCGGMQIMWVLNNIVSGRTNLVIGMGQRKMLLNEGQEEAALLLHFIKRKRGLSV